MLDVQIETEGLSEATKAVLELPGLFARARASALKSLGYHIQQDLKMEAKRAVNGGYLRWDPLNPHTGILARTKDRFGRKRGLGYKRTRRNGQVISRTSTRREPFSRLSNAIRYKVDAEEDFVEIGFLNPKPHFFVWLKKHARGYTVPVTPRMRKKFFALGFPLKKETTQLQVPARPWVSPVEAAWSSKVLPFFEKKFWDSYNRYTSGRSK